MHLSKCTYAVFPYKFKTFVDVFKRSGNIHLDTLLFVNGLTYNPGTASCFTFKNI